MTHVGEGSCWTRASSDGRRVCRWVASLSAAIVLASTCEGVAAAQARTPLVPSAAAHYPPGTHYKPLCPTADEHGRRCFGQELVDANDKPITDATSPPGGWTPGELEAAYGLPSTGGSGTVIATYIGSHYTNAEADAAAYRSHFGMSPCTSASGCFTHVTAAGTTDFSGLSDDGCSGMVGEESLDVDMLMAGCPNCKILIIEGSDNASAISTAQAHTAVSISMSWGYTPESESDCEANWVPPAGLALFAASGDSGYAATPGEPGSCTDVVAVGWTQLATDTSTRGYADTIPSGWGSAGGCDSAMTKASWQTDPSCSTRMISDISANGDNVAAYCTSPTSSAGWHVTGGSSAASPFTTGVLATLGVTGGSFDAAWLYANEAKFWDVTSGGPVQNCPSGSPTYFCNAVPGYDGPTGVGTPYGPGLTGVSNSGGDAGSTSTTCQTPSGSYSQSCAGCAAEPAGSGCVLTCATCTEVNGTKNPNPSLPLPCDGAIVNDNGQLQCIGSTSSDAGSSSEGGAPADGGGASIDDGGGGGIDATVTPPSFDAGGGLSVADDASTGGGLGVGPGGGGTNGSAGCALAEVPPRASPASMVLIGGVFVAWGWRRRRKSSAR
jgi:hypothetical protein